MKKRETSPFGIDSYKAGDPYVFCERTGMKCRKSEIRREWTGLRVHKDWWDPKHPQLLVKSKFDKIAQDEPRGEPADTFLTTNEVTVDDL